jgi:hypothetical protein
MLVQGTEALGGTQQAFYKRLEAAVSDLVNSATFSDIVHSLLEGAYD